MDIRRLAIDDLPWLMSAGHLFDGPVKEAAALRFLDSPSHHLFMAIADGRPVGFVSGVELTHPDKGTEMFLYELAVEETFQRQGIGRRLVQALADLAVERGCYGMWVGTERDNRAALATYRAAGADEPSDFVLFNWTFEAPGTD